MCGIIGYVGTKQAAPKLLEGLQRLEYRGYDSAGLCVQDTKLTTVKSKGAITNLREKISRIDVEGTCGIAHTRWATHGVPEEYNAHPHRDCSGGVAIVHNGIIENYRELKAQLVERGHVFESDTDSEVLAHMIEEERRVDSALSPAVKRVLSSVRGTYGLVVLAQDEKQTLVVARMGSPLVIGMGKGEFFVASDASAIVGSTKDLVYLEDGEMAVMTSEGVSLEGSSNRDLTERISHIDWNVDTVTKEGFPHFMLKEIFDQPDVIENSTRGRMDLIEGRCVLGGLSGVQEQLRTIDRLIVVGCGSAYYAGLFGKQVIEELVGIPVDVELASEFRYRNPIITPTTAVLAISQSGETADTLEAVREAKRRGALTLGLVNTVGSSIARETVAGVYNHAGPEIGVASTKAFVSQLTVLTLIAVYLGQLRQSTNEGHAILASLAELPGLVRKTFDCQDAIQKIAQTLKDADHAFFLGRGLYTALAYEGALKLKETSYVHAEGYSSAEMKHGPIALVQPGFPCVMLCPYDEMFEKNWSSIQELSARGATVFAVTTNSATLDGLMNTRISVPSTHRLLQPILFTIPLQLLAYETSVARGLNPDKPRNLAKSVTVE